MEKADCRLRGFSGPAFVVDSKYVDAVRCCVTVAFLVLVLSGFHCVYGGRDDAGIDGENFDPMFAFAHLSQIVRVSRLTLDPERVLEM